MIIDANLLQVSASFDYSFYVGRDGVTKITRLADGSADFIHYADKTLVYVRSSLGHHALYPLRPVAFRGPAKAVMMDLDGTTLNSEGFWVSMLELAVADLRGDSSFSYSPDDIPHVVGHSVSDHLSYSLAKYCPEGSLEGARARYTAHVRRNLSAIDSEHAARWFEPAEGRKGFLTELKAAGIKIGLVTSGLYEKAWPEICSVFKTIGLGDPADFYDGIVTAGATIAPGFPGTLGELFPKPHPWLYAEMGTIAFGTRQDERPRVVGIEDSAAGALSVRLAGYPVFGLRHGSIQAAGAEFLTERLVDSLPELLPRLLR